MNLSRKPSQAGGLIQQWVGAELLVHSLRDGQVHCLNPLAAKIFEACDGERTWEEILDGLPESLSAADLQTLGRTFSKLESLNLLAKPETKGSRREFIAQGIKAAAVLPVILSVATASPAAAGSGICQPFTACNDCPGSCCGDPCDGCVVGGRLCLQLLDHTGAPAVPELTCSLPGGVDPACLVAGFLDCSLAKFSCCLLPGCGFFACCGTTSCVCPPGTTNPIMLGFNQVCGQTGTDGLACCDGSGTCDEGAAMCV